MVRKISILILTLIIVPILLMSGCSQRNGTDTPGEIELTRLQAEETMDMGGLKLVSKSHPARLGETFTITAQGRGGVTYTITGTYRKNGRTYTAYRNATADENGLVRWSWVISADTEPGTYPLLITGGDDTFASSYQVQK